MSWTRREFCHTGAASLAALGLPLAAAQARSRHVLDAKKQFARFAFWTNRDWDWYAANLPPLGEPASPGG